MCYRGPGSGPRNLSPSPGLPTSLRCAAPVFQWASRRASTLLRSERCEHCGRIDRVLTVLRAQEAIRIQHLPPQLSGGCCARWYEHRLQPAKLKRGMRRARTLQGQRTGACEGCSLFELTCGHLLALVARWGLPALVRLQSVCWLAGRSYGMPLSLMGACRHQLEGVNQLFALYSSEPPAHQLPHAPATPWRCLARSQRELSGSKRSQH